MEYVLRWTQSTFHQMLLDNTSHHLRLKGIGRYLGDENGDLLSEVRSRWLETMTLDKERLLGQNAGRTQTIHEAHPAKIRHLHCLQKINHLAMYERGIRVHRTKHDRAVLRVVAQYDESD